MHVDDPCRNPPSLVHMLMFCIVSHARNRNPCIPLCRLAMNTIGWPFPVASLSTGRESTSRPPTPSNASGINLPSLLLSDVSPHQTPADLVALILVARESTGAIVVLPPIPIPSPRPISG